MPSFLALEQPNCIVESLTLTHIYVFGPIEAAENVLWSLRPPSFCARTEEKGIFLPSGQKKRRDGGGRMREPRSETKLKEEKAHETCPKLSERDEAVVSTSRA